nr:hypothetical protein [Tanacetum cinerariifolium]GEZ21551.1 hypothetical protein [Tanacetum cinerariifolium]
MFIEFVIQNQFFSYSLEEFAQILDIPCEGVYVFTDKWSLDELAYGVPTDGPYQTNPPSPNDIISHWKKLSGKTFSVWGIIRTMFSGVFITCFIVLYTLKVQLAYYMAKRMEWVTKQKRLVLPYGMLLTRLFKFIMNENPELHKESYVVYDGVMNPLAAQLKRKNRKDRGTRRGHHSTSSSTFNQPSSSHLNDDDVDGNDKGTSRANNYLSTSLVMKMSPPHFLLTTSSSSTPSNAPSKTTSTNQTSSSQENTSSSFQLKLQISPPSLNEPTSPHPLNPLLDNILDVPPRPLNPQPL